MTETYLLVFLSQTLFNIFKVLEIKLTYENKTNALMVNSIFINLVSLTSTYFSIENRSKLFKVLFRKDQV
jgi:hypothetical protein